MTKGPRPWAVRLERKVLRIRGLLLALLFSIAATVCFRVAVRIWQSPGEWERWAGLCLVSLTGVACVMLALHAWRQRPGK